MTRITTQKQVEGPLARKLHGLGGNLYLNVESATSRQWQYIWKRDGRQRTRGLGSATGSGKTRVTLVEARKAADRCRSQLANGSDPLVEARRETVLLGAYATTYIDKHKGGWSSSKTEKNWRRSFTLHAASLASHPVATLATADIKAVLEPLWTAKKETARHLRRRFESVLRAAKADGLRSGDNPATLENLGLPKHRKKGAVRHHPALPYEKLPSLMTTIAGKPETLGMLPLRLLVLSATRTNEAAGAEWSEFDLVDRLWTIPASRVKSGADHHVPLTPEMLALLGALTAQRVDGEPRLFPDCGSNQMLKALKRLEGCESCTVHGFRSTFRDWCGNETAFAREVVEETYGHDPSLDAAERAYRRKKAMKKRRMVLEAWNRYAVSAQAKVLPFAPVKAA